MNLFDSINQRVKSQGKAIFVIALVIVAFALGYYLPGSRDTKVTPVESKEAVGADRHDHDRSKEVTEAKKTQWWTCSMHPQIRLPHPGKCPICFMDLIPLESDTGGGAETSLTQYSMSEAAKKLAEVQTEAVKRERAKVQVQNGWDGCTRMRPESRP